jgi:hypothetical protein
MIPKKAKKKNSKEVNWRANVEMIGAKTARKIIPTMVPIKEAVVVRPRALPASPLQAKG